MICKKCGKSISDDSTFCCFCGSSVEVENEDVKENKIDEEKIETQSVQELAEKAPAPEENVVVKEEPDFLSMNYSTPVVAIVGFILAFLSPIHGLILSFLAYKDLQKKGNPNTLLCKAGIIVSGIVVVLLIVSVVLSLIVGIIAGIVYENY